MRSFSELAICERCQEPGSGGLDDQVLCSNCIQNALSVVEKSENETL